MAVRCNASGEYVRQTAIFDATTQQGWSACGWCKFTPRSSADQFFGFDNGGAQFSAIGRGATSSVGIDGGCYDGNSVYQIRSSYTSETWFFWAMAEQGIFWDGTANGNCTVAIWNGSTWNEAWSWTNAVPTRFTLGMCADDTWWMNAAYSHVRIWKAALTDTEFEAEMASSTPVRTSNLTVASSFDSDATDSSGNGNNWSVTGSVTYEDGPFASPMVWYDHEGVQPWASVWRAGRF